MPAFPPFLQADHSPLCRRTTESSHSGPWTLGLIPPLALGTSAAASLRVLCEQPCIRNLSDVGSQCPGAPLPSSCEGRRAGRPQSWVCSGVLRARCVPSSRLGTGPGSPSPPALPGAPALRGNSLIGVTGTCLVAPPARADLHGLPVPEPLCRVPVFLCHLSLQCLGWRCERFEVMVVLKEELGCHL